MKTQNGFVTILGVIVLLISIIAGAYLYINSDRVDDADVPKENNFTFGLLAKKNTPITITFVGDLMVDRYIREIAEEESYDYLFKEVSNHLSQSDMVVANLEGPITDYESIYKYESHPSTYSFTFDKKIVESLFKTNIRNVFLDNNHITNYGDSGVKQTINNLQKGNISYFGLPKENDILYKTVKDIDLSFVSYNQFIASDIDITLRDIRNSASRSDQVIVFTHWGDEYEKDPNDTQIGLAHKFIDNGADIVIGTHPHVIQKKEKYKGKYIYYSLGNFIFDQYFNEDVRCGAVVSFILDKDEVISIKEEFVYLDPKTVVKFSDCSDKVEYIN